MNTKQFSIFSLPITHTLLLITLTICATIFATLFHHMYALASFYAIGTCIAFYKKDNSLIATTLCLLFFSFITTSRINQQFARYKSDQAWLHKPVTIEGVVTSISTSSLTKDQTTITLCTTSIQNNKKQLLSKQKNISLFAPSKLCTQVKESQQIKISYIKLEQPYHDSEYQRYLLKEGIWAIAHCTNHGIEIIKEQNPTIQSTYLRTMHNALSSTAKTLFDPLFLGKKEKNLHALDIQHRSMYWGASHHMARSGVHLSVLFGLLMLLFHYASIAHWLRYIISATILLIYAYISFSSISFLRALFMILLHIICKLFKKIPSTLHILTLTTIATLLYNPMQILFLDFQLSFGITYILIWLFLVKEHKTIAFL